MFVVLRHGRGTLPEVSTDIVGCRVTAFVVSGGCTDWLSLAAIITVFLIKDSRVHTLAGLGVQNYGPSNCDTR